MCVCVWVYRAVGPRGKAGLSYFFDLVDLIRSEIVLCDAMLISDVVLERAELFGVLALGLSSPTIGLADELANDVLFLAVGRCVLFAGCTLFVGCTFFGRTFDCLLFSAFAFFAPVDWVAGRELGGSAAFAAVSSEVSLAVSSLTWFGSCPVETTFMYSLPLARG